MSCKESWGTFRTAQAWHFCRNLMVVARCRYSKLAWLKRAHFIAINSFLVNLVTFLRIAPAGVKDVHDMLSSVAVSLVAGGETGTVTRGSPERISLKWMWECWRQAHWQISMLVKQAQKVPAQASDDFFYV